MNVNNKKGMIMKKAKYFSFAVALIMTFSSCSQLDLAPEDWYGSNNFWNNEAQVKGYIYGIHKQIRDNNINFWLMGEVRGGTLKLTPSVSTTSVSMNYISPFIDQGFTKDKPGLTAWGLYNNSSFYNKILNVNLAIQKVEEECSFLSDSNRQYYLGQLYGIRAFYYFWLYRTYGGVPIVTDAKVMEGVATAQELYLERSTPKATLDFIKADVLKSETAFGNNLTLTDNKSVWSKYATLMLKAEVYLWSAKVTTGDQAPSSTDITTAESALMSVKNSGTFSLLPNFADVFKYTNKGNNEIIFTQRFLDNEASNNVSQLVYDVTFVANAYTKAGKLMGDTLLLKGVGLQRNEYDFPFWQAFSANDTRRNATFLDFYYKDKSGNLTVNGTILRKFMGLLNATGNRVFADDIAIYRYADVLLMLAEVANKKGEDPSPYINAIRLRAYGSGYPVYTNQNFAANELAILAEKDREFVFENKRWFDVVRMQDAAGKSLAFSSAPSLLYGRTAPLLATGEEYKLLMPVDVNTLNKDPELKQTPGY
jgi:starch-binding outer membrane protein, SusD/RagB family